MGPPQNFVLGTAGHIDHGKTALVRALTGVDTDQTLDPTLGDYAAVKFNNDGDVWVPQVNIFKLRRFNTLSYDQ